MRKQVLTLAWLSTHLFVCECDNSRTRLPMSPTFSMCATVVKDRKPLDLQCQGQAPRSKSKILILIKVHI